MLVFPPNFWQQPCWTISFALWIFIMLSSEVWSQILFFINAIYFYFIESHMDIFKSYTSILENIHSRICGSAFSIVTWTYERKISQTTIFLSIKMEIYSNALTLLPLWLYIFGPWVYRVNYFLSRGLCYLFVQVLFSFVFGNAIIWVSRG